MSDIEKWVKVPAAMGYSIPGNARVLDLGCGNGNGVQTLLEMGYDAVGCDLQFNPGPYCERLQRAGLIRQIDPAPYRLPFDDAEFDGVFSKQVLEHVQNYDETLAEIRRVLRPTGVSLHVFPSRGRFIEGHVHVPLASVFRLSWWLLFWAWLGVRKHSQRGWTPEKIARRNRYYLTTQTNYLTRREIVHVVRRHFKTYAFCEREAIPYSRLAPLYPVLRVVPGFGQILSSFQTRVLLLKALFMTVWRPSTRSAENSCGIRQG